MGDELSSALADARTAEEDAKTACDLGGVDDDDDGDDASDADGSSRLKVSTDEAGKLRDTRDAASAAVAALVKKLLPATDVAKD